MVFIHPTWFEGLLIQIVYLIIPIIFGFCLWVILSAKDKKVIGSVVFTIFIVLSVFGASYLWWINYEVPSIDEKVVTVESWQPKAGLHQEDGEMMVIDNANQLMLVTTDGESYLNDENFFFNKFNTRDILNTLKENGTYKIKYYGWREGFNSGFPNILSVEQVIDESNVSNIKYSDYFGTKVI